MKSEEQFDHTIRVAFIKEVEPLEASPDALERIKERINRGEGLTKTGLRQKLANYTYVLNFHKPAVALFCILIFAGLILVFNKPARVLAEEGIKKVIEMIYVVVRNEDGSYDTSQVSMDLSQISPFIGEPAYLDDDELTREVGFNAKTPENLDGYILWDTSIYKTENSPQKMVIKKYLQGSKRLGLEIAVAEEVFMVNKVSYIEYGEEFKIQNVLVKYLKVHSPVYPTITKGASYEFDPAEKPIEIKTSNVMAWEYQGVHYRLYGFKVTLKEFKEVTVSLVKALQQNETSGTKPSNE